MTSYRLLDGEKLDLRESGGRERAFLRDLEKMVDEGVSYFEVYRTAIGPGSPALGGRNRVDRERVTSPLYRAARDIALRAGIKQGLILAPEHESRRADVPRDATMISVAQAADLIGISRAAVYKAIEKGTLGATHVGNVTLVERASAHAYRERRGTKPGHDTPRRPVPGGGRSRAHQGLAAKSG